MIYRSNWFKRYRLPLLIVGLICYFLVFFYCTQYSLDYCLANILSILCGYLFGCISYLKQQQRKLEEELNYITERKNNWQKKYDLLQKITAEEIIRLTEELRRKNEQ